MKRLSLIILASVLLFAGCDKIEGPYYTTRQHEDVSVVFPELDRASVHKKILIEEFTGHRCTNCPEAHDVLASLHDLYKDTLIIVGIHSTVLANPAPNAGMPYDFRTPVGNELTKHFDIGSLPKAIINREAHPGGWSKGEWGNVIKACDRSKVYAAVQMINQFNTPTNNTLKVNVKVTMFEDCKDPVKLSLLLIEDSIVQPQSLPHNIIDTFYVHNHVLRSDINGFYGEYLTQDGHLEKDSSYTYAYTINFNEHDWDPTKCSVVAILYDSDPNNEFVLQVESLPVLNNKSPYSKISY